MGTRTSLTLLAVALLGLGVWLAVRDPAPVEAPPILDETPSSEPESAAQEPGPMLEAVDRRPQPETPAAKPDDAEGEGDILYTGEVVDAENRPVAGAVVTARWRGAVLREVTTDEKGAFRFRASFDVDDSRFVSGVVIARGPHGGAAYGWFVIAQPTRPGVDALPAARTIYRLVLKPGAALEVVVSTSCPDGLPATVWIVGTDFASTEAIAIQQTDASGRLTLESLPQGRWRAIAAAEGCGRDTALVQLPQPEPKTIELQIPEARRLTVRVREKENEKPIPGATIGVEEYVRLPNEHGRGSLLSVPSHYVTDDQGVAVIDGLGTKEKLTLRAAAEGFPGSQGRFRRGGQGEVRAEPTAEEVTIELQRPRTVRWPIADEGQGIPPDGTAVTLKPFTNSGLIDIPRSGTVEEQHIVVAGWGPGFAAGLAYVEGFGAARLSAGPGEAVGYPAAFYPLRKIELFATESDGKPAEGIYLMARDGGNNAVAPGVKTDAKGYAVMRDLYAGPGSRVNCTASRTAQEYGGLPVGTVDLFRQDGRFEYTLPAERAMRVTLTVDGKPPPPGFSAFTQVGAQPIVLKPDAQGVCEVTFSPVKPTGEISLYLRLNGYQAGPAKASLDGPDPIEMAIELTRTGSARIKVLLPEDGRNKVVAQGWDAEKGEWLGNVSANSYNFSMGGASVDANGILTLPNLRPGRYRAVDTYTGKRGEPFDVVAGEEPAESTLDLSKSGWVKGRVVPPPGISVNGFTVGVEGETSMRSFRMFGTSGGLPGTAVNAKDGTFHYRVSGDAPVTLRIYHVTCLPHRTKGRVTVDGPREGIELHAEAGPKATVRLAEALQMFMNPGQQRTVQIRLYEGEVKGEGTGLTGLLNGSADTVEFGGFEPGTYTVWIDTLTAAPLVLRNVVLGKEDVDLGEHRTTHGSRLLIHVKVKAGQSPPRMHLTATSADDPTYIRNTDRSGEMITLSGIGAGRFQIHGGFYAGTGGIHEEITFDGKTDVERTIDLR